MVLAMSKALFALLALILLCPPALASGGDHAAPPEHGEDGEQASATGEEGQRVVLPVLIAPVVEGARLSGYLYLSLRLTAASNSDANRLRDVLPLIQDRLLRALHNAPVAAAVADAPATRDTVLKTVTDALQSLGDIGAVKDVAFADFQNVPF